MKLLIVTITIYIKTIFPGNLIKNKKYNLQICYKNITMYVTKSNIKFQNSQKKYFKKLLKYTTYPNS